MLIPNRPLATHVAMVKQDTDEQLALAFHAEQTTRLVRRLLGHLYGASDDESTPPTRAA